MEQPKEQDVMGPLLPEEGDVGEQVPAQKGRDGAELVLLSAARRCQDPQRDREGVRIQFLPIESRVALKKVLDTPVTGPL